LAADDPETEPTEEEEKDAPCSPEGVGDQDAPGIVIEGAVVGSGKGGVSVARERETSRRRGGEGEGKGKGQGSAREEQGDSWQILGVPIKVGVGCERDKCVGRGREVDGHNYRSFYR